MPRLKAPIYKSAITPAFAGQNRNFREDSISHRRLHWGSNREGRSRRGIRTYRSLLWSLAAGLKMFGIVAAFLIAMRTGWLGATAVFATLAGVKLRFILEATSYGD